MPLQPWEMARVRREAMGAGEREGTCTPSYLFIVMPWPFASFLIYCESE